MFQLRLMPAFIVAASVTCVASQAFAIASFHYGHAGAGHVSTPKMPTPTPKIPVHTGGGYNGGHWGGCCGNGGHAIWTKPRLGQHSMGMHYYGMGSHSIKAGAYLHAHFGFHAGGYGGGGSWGGGSHVPSGTHPMGMHYYGLSGGSLAKKYGQLLHPYGTSIPSSPSYAAYSGHKAGRWGYNHWGYSTPTTPTGGTSPSHNVYSARFSFKERFSYHYFYHAKSGGSGSHKGVGNHWGYTKPSGWGYAYAVK